ncbi:ABC transporter ATP-binding protein [uncultured Clostridium sp.]|jgi:ABC-2 type transport system ATP-binding protein|uniref:ABC transporter ATP-binding protein n=1 Tax=uncultured Clostridium sp. TaxID=59620 RepID=UPI00262697DE|nr:ABC transporter ATP-binding protein [uncultured Clostridium sp.]
MIEIKNAMKKYKGKNALDGLSVTIEEGKITALLGINGVGKSTTLKSIMGLTKLTKGEILVDGEKVTHNTYNKLAFVPDVDNYYAYMSVEEAFEFMNDFYINWDMDKAYKMAEELKVDINAKIAKMSKGNIAKVKIILGFAQNAKYLLLDEPFSGIDIFTREKFISSIIRYMSDDMAIVITTHEIKEIENIADDVILLDEGKLVLKFNAQEVKEEEGLSIVEKMREVYSDVI